MGHDHTKGTAGCPACKASSKPVKAKIPLKCMVHLRPLDSWKGEFGFDWMRIGGPGEAAGEVPYTDVANGGVKEVGELPGGDYGVTKEYTTKLFPGESITEAYEGLKWEYDPYKIIPEIASAPLSLKEYFIPYISLYPKNKIPQSEWDQKPGSRRFMAELQVVIAIEKPAPVKIELEYDESAKNLFLLEYTFSDMAVGAKRKSADTVKISCLEEFSGIQEISIMAYPAGWKDKKDAFLVGMLKVFANHAKRRKERKFVYVKVITRIETTLSTGQIKPKETKALVNSLHQALIHPIVEFGPDLDLSEDGNFHYDSDDDEYGKFIFHNHPYREKLKDKGIYHTDESYEYVKKKFLNDPANKSNATLYKDHFLIFCFDELSYMTGAGQHTEGAAQEIGVPNLFLFKTRRDSTLSHEALHCMGLQHAHKEKNSGGDFLPIESNRTRTFVLNTTDNLMSYSKVQLTLWHWQWQTINDWMH